MAIGGLPQQGAFPQQFGGQQGLPGQIPGQPGQQPGGQGGLVPLPQQDPQAFIRLAIAGGLGDVRTQTFQTLQESSTQARQAMDRFKGGGGGGGGQ